MNQSVKKYLSQIGQKGGSLSRRELSPVQAREMVKIREARRAFRRFYALCFWSSDPNMIITGADIPWVAQQLMKNGNQETWKIGANLCR